VGLRGKISVQGGGLKQRTCRKKGTAERQNNKAGGRAGSNIWLQRQTQTGRGIRSQSRNVETKVTHSGAGRPCGRRASEEKGSAKKMRRRREAPMPQGRPGLSTTTRERRMCHASRVFKKLGLAEAGQDRNKKKGEAEKKKSEKK